MPRRMLRPAVFARAPNRRSDIPASAKKPSMAISATPTPAPTSINGPAATLPNRPSATSSSAFPRYSYPLCWMAQSLCTYYPIPERFNFLATNVRRLSEIKKNLVQNGFPLCRFRFRFPNTGHDRCAQLVNVPNYCSRRTSPTLQIVFLQQMPILRTIKENHRTIENKVLIGNAAVIRNHHIRCRHHVPIVLVMREYYFVKFLQLLQ